MKLYHRRFADNNKNVGETDEKQKRISRNDIGHLFNQAVIWMTIIFLAVGIMKRIF